METMEKNYAGFTDKMTGGHKARVEEALSRKLIAGDKVMTSGEWCYAKIVTDGKSVVSEVQKRDDREHPVYYLDGVRISRTEAKFAKYLVSKKNNASETESKPEEGDKTSEKTLEEFAGKKMSEKHKPYSLATKQSTFYKYTSNGKSGKYIEYKGYRLEADCQPGIVFYLSKGTSGKTWNVTEESTGFAAGGYSDTRKEAIENFMEIAPKFPDLKTNCAKTVAEFKAKGIVNPIFMTEEERSGWKKTEEQCNDNAEQKAKEVKTKEISGGVMLNPVANEVTRAIEGR